MCVLGMKQYTREENKNKVFFLVKKESDRDIGPRGPTVGTRLNPPPFSSKGITSTTARGWVGRVVGGQMVHVVHTEKSLGSSSLWYLPITLAVFYSNNKLNDVFFFNSLLK